MGLNPKGRNWGSLVNWDDLGKAYTGFILAWTIVLISGCAWLILNRRVPFIRMRNLPLAFASTAFLHVYLVKIVLAYTTNGHFLCSAEFWIMSIYLPFGIALYQANVTQLVSTSSRQRGLLLRQLSSSSLESATSWRKITGFRARWTRLTAVERSYVLIGTFMVVQVIITAALYATSPILQGDWSSFGHIPYAKGQAKCRKSLSWVPSAFWQLFWSWVYGPYILYKIRNIKDAHYWRLQVILSIVCGLPGTPLWIAAVFNTAFKPVNRWFVPPMWLAPGIIVMQLTTIFIPIYEYYENRAAIHHMSNESSQWEKDGQQSESSSEPTGSSSQRNLRDSSVTEFFEGLAEGQSGKDMYRMAALERALQLNPSPLLRFAATKDFTAENIIFLMHLAAWRSAWRSASRDPATRQVTAYGRQDLFNMALDIYMASVCEQTAEVAINIEHPIAKALQNIFEPYMPATRTNSETSLATSAPSYNLQNITDTTQILQATDDKEPHLAVASIFTCNSSPPASPASWKQEHGVLDVQQQAVEDAGETLPDGFDEHVFDRAEASIKYLVLTNTWRKFVQSRHDAMSRSEV